MGLLLCGSRRMQSAPLLFFRYEAIIFKNSVIDYDITGLWNKAFFFVVFYPSITLRKFFPGNTARQMTSLAFIRSDGNSAAFPVILASFFLVALSIEASYFVLLIIVIVTSPKNTDYYPKIYDISLMCLTRCFPSSPIIR